MHASPARKIALKILWQIEEKGAYANQLIEIELGRTSILKSDQKLAYLLVYGVLRHRNRLDWVISSYSKYPIENLTPWIRNILRMGVYQLVDMPELKPGIAVNESVELAHRYGHRGTVSLVNAILHKVASEGQGELPDIKNDPEGHLRIAQSHPGWLVRRWLKRYGYDTAAKICSANNLIPPLTIRLNRLKMRDGKHWQSALENPVQSREIPEGVIIDGPRPITCHPFYKEGEIDIQTLSSMLMAHLLGVKPGERILDICAGSGGKSCHMADLMENKGEILCVDKRGGKITALNKRAKRLGVKICYPLCGTSDKETGWKDGIFDRILVDVPCSSLGIIKRHPEIKWLRKEEDIFSMARIQKEILGNAARALRKGGRLLYCACSLEPEETYDIMSVFIKEHPSFNVINLKENLPNSWQDLADKKGAVQLMPFYSGMDGFFAFSVTK